jgi:hypothetical protein
MERQRAMAEFNAEIETTPVFQVFTSVVVLGMGMTRWFVCERGLC